MAAPQRRPAPGPSGDAFRLTDAEFGRIRERLHRDFGIAVDPGKRALVASKVGRLVARAGHTSWTDYERVELAPGGGRTGLSDFIDQLTTNHTFWWREPAHFTVYRDRVLPELEQRLRGTRDLRTWCAVCSTGEEAWTLAMLQRQHFGGRYGQWRAGVLATDISSRALRTAAEGVYDAEHIAALPEDVRRGHFETTADGRRRIVPALRDEVLFRRLNLMRRPLPFKKPLHVIFCRNVMIYFDPPTIRDLSRALHDALAPGGYLFVGHSEPLERQGTPFEVVGPSIYRRRL